MPRAEAIAASVANYSPRSVLMTQKRIQNFKTSKMFLCEKKGFPARKTQNQNQKSKKRADWELADAGFTESPGNVFEKYIHIILIMV